MIKKITSLLMLCCTTVLSAQNTSNSLPLLPEPNFVQLQEGNFYLSDSTVIVAEPTLNEAIILRQYLEDNYKIHVRIDMHYPPFKNFIAFLTPANDGVEHNKEAYDLKVSPKGITIKAYDLAGTFYALQTLMQLLPTDFSSTRLKVPSVQIFDQPRFAYRGMHLDCCRHFFSVDEVKRYIELLALYKFNTFHWHLTDDQGWRVEIKKYPLLTQIGGWRDQTLIGKPSKKNMYDHKRYGGFYTQEEIRQIVIYATLKHITIVPEIEMPGHSLAALAAYPQYSCTGGPFKVGDTWGVYDDVFCPGNDSTFSFLQDILDEVCELFPSTMIHVGGDECEKGRWKMCPKCQQRIQTENLKDEHGLQSYFITRIEKYLNSKGRKIIGWDEILEGGLAPNAAVMSWRGISGGLAAAQMDHQVVMSPGKPLYFDHYQSRDKSKEPMAIGGFNPVDSVYAYEPVPTALPTDKQSYILGAQANIWTEYITNFQQVEYMALPRMIALSEVLWTSTDRKNYTLFLKRLKQHKVLLDHRKLNYAKHVFQEQQDHGNKKKLH